MVYYKKLAWNGFVNKDDFIIVLDNFEMHQFLKEENIILFTKKI